MTSLELAPMYPGVQRFTIASDGDIQMPSKESVPKERSTPTSIPAVIAAFAVIPSEAISTR